MEPGDSPNPLLPSPAYADYVARLENSTGNPNARNARSSATGDGQFIDSTFLSLMKRTRPELVAGKSDAEILALRADPKISREMIVEYGKENAPLLAKAGLPVNDQTLRLMHFGPGNALPILKAPPGAMVRDLVPADSLAANPTWQNMTAADWIAKNTGQGGDSAGGGANNAPPGTVGSAIEALALLGQKPQVQAAANPLMPGQQQTPAGAGAAAGSDVAAIEAAKRQQALLSMLAFAGAVRFRPVTYNPWANKTELDSSPARISPTPSVGVRPMKLVSRFESPTDKYFLAGSAAGRQPTYE